jgi:hypothetical protein
MFHPLEALKSLGIAIRSLHSQISKVFVQGKSLFQKALLDEELFYIFIKTWSNCFF